MKCRLCDREEKLIKAHIIPDFLYSGMFNEHHRVIYTSFPELSSKSTRPTGIYDKNILCKKCDNEVLGNFETYAKKVLETGHGLNIKQSRVGEESVALTVENIDYKKFKLFLLSILFKASITTQDFFGNIKLESSIENRLKEMLIGSDPGAETEFPVVLLALRLKYKDITNGMMGPIPVNMGSHDAGFVFLINGLFYWYLINGTVDNKIFEKAPIKLTNSMLVPIMTGDLGLKFYNKLTRFNIR